MKRLLVCLARSPFARCLIGWLFTHMSFVLPVDRLRETPTLLAPRPSLASLTAADSAFMVDLFAAWRVWSRKRG